MSLALRSVSQPRPLLSRLPRALPVLLGIVISQSCQAVFATAPSVVPSQPPFNVERASARGTLIPLSAVQLAQAGQQIGAGQFYVSVLALHADDSGEPVRAYLLSAAPTLKALRNQDSTIRLWIDSTQLHRRKDDTGDNEWLNLVWSTMAGSQRDAATVERQMPSTVIAALYSGRASLARDGVAVSGAAPAIVKREASGALVWTGRIFSPDGAIEEVKVSVARKEEIPLTVKRVVVAPAGTRGGTFFDDAAVEEWAIEKQALWTPSRRYQLRLTLATMRNDPVRKYDLAVVMLRDPDPGAHNEGMQLLREAAAQNYPSAISLLRELATNPQRALTDRELTRLER